MRFGGAGPCTAREALGFQPVTLEEPGTGSGGSSPPLLSGGTVTVAHIDAVATTFGASPAALETALAPVGSRPATLVYPATTGKAAIVWDSADGQANTVTISNRGGVSVLRTRTAVPRRQ